MVPPRSLLLVLVLSDAETPVQSRNVGYLLVSYVGQRNIPGSLGEKSVEGITERKPGQVGGNRRVHVDAGVVEGVPVDEDVRTGTVAKEIDGVSKAAFTSAGSGEPQRKHSFERSGRAGSGPRDPWGREPSRGKGVGTKKVTPQQPRGEKSGHGYCGQDEAEHPHDAHVIWLAATPPIYGANTKPEGNHV